MSLGQPDPYQNYFQQREQQSLRKEAEDFHQARVQRMYHDRALEVREAPDKSNKKLLLLEASRAA